MRSMIIDLIRRGRRQGRVRFRLLTGRSCREFPWITTLRSDYVTIPFDKRDRDTYGSRKDKYSSPEEVLGTLLSVSDWHYPSNPSVVSCRRLEREMHCSTKDENYCHLPFKIFSTTYCDYLIVLCHELLMHDFVRNHGTDRHTIALIFDICVTLRVREKQDDSITWISSVEKSFRRISVMSCQESTSWH